VLVKSKRTIDLGDDEETDTDESPESSPPSVQSSQGYTALHRLTTSSCRLGSREEPIKIFSDSDDEESQERYYSQPSTTDPAGPVLTPFSQQDNEDDDILQSEEEELGQVIQSLHLTSPERNPEAALDDGGDELAKLLNRQHEMRELEEQSWSYALDQGRVGQQGAQRSQTGPTAVVNTQRTEDISSTRR
jgi:hypothetical protein